MKKIQKFFSWVNIISWKRTFRIMKVSFILITVTLASFANGIYSQSRSLTFRLEKVNLIEIFEQIEKQSDMKVAYDVSNINIDQRINFAVDDASIENVLKKALENTDLSYRVINHYAVIYPKDNELSSNGQQQKSITGKVTDLSGSSLPGVSIVVKGTVNGTISDSDGKYTLNNVTENDTLQFSFVGMKTQEIAIGGKTNINVTLGEETVGIEEIVVIGYGTVKKKDLSGAVGVVKMNQLDKQINTNMQTALQGKIAGVSVISSGGGAGAEMNVKIRGIGTINDNNPLYIVDGVPSSAVNPNDIESIQVLKDAASAAIYGSRAANGVILITTKTGHKGPIKFDMNADYGIQQLGKKLDLCTTDEWIKVTTELFKPNPAGFDLPEIAQNPQEPGEGIDWQDQVYRNASVQNYTIGASGGSENFTYSTSIGYLNQDGIIIKNNYNRLSLRVNSEFTKGRFKFGERIYKQMSETGVNIGDNSDGPATAATQMVPAFSIYDENAVGGYNGVTGTGEIFRFVCNPVARINLSRKVINSDHLSVNLFAEAALLDGLKFKSDLSIVGDEEEILITNARSEIGAYFVNPRNNAKNQSNSTKFWQLENTLSYVKTIAEKHSINAVIGQTSSKSQYSGFSSYSEGMPDGIWSLDASTMNMSVEGYSSVNSLESFLGRLIYSYDNRYIITGTFRRDGSSRFSKDVRWGNFPSVSAAWNIANEPFFYKLGTPVSELKLRGSWGKLGNQNVGDYLYSETILTGGGEIWYAAGTPNSAWIGSIQTSLANSSLKWEATTTKNVGLDLGLWNGQLNFTVDVFDKTTTNMLMLASGLTPLSVGSSMSFVNAGNISNSGYEMTLNYNGGKGDFRYSVTGTLSHIKNRVNDLYETELTGDVGTRWGLKPVLYCKPGYPVWGFFLVQTDGLFRSEAEIQAYNKDGMLIQPDAKVGDVRFKDASKDGKIDDNDRVYCGSPFPDYDYGLRLDGSWKFFDASLFLQGTLGGKIFNSKRVYLESGRYIVNYSKDLLNSYTFNTNSDIPRLEYNDPNGNGMENTDRWLEDGSYCRLRTMQIGYTLPEIANKRLAISKCRIYIAADNLITWTRYKGYNPDIGNNGGSNSGVDKSTYPLSKSYHIGLQLSF